MYVCMANKTKSSRLQQKPGTNLIDSCWFEASAVFTAPTVLSSQVPAGNGGIAERLRGTADGRPLLSIKKYANSHILTGLFL